VLRQNRAWKWFVFAESNGLKPACPLKAKAKAANAAE
jgi:hypothetical protein